jgi:hypothetical protein
MSMMQRNVGSLGVVAVFVALAVLGVHAQGPAKGPRQKEASQSSIPRTPDGHPDFQGSWTTATYTPFERPAELGNREYFTPDEAADFAKRSLERFLAQPEDEAHYDNAIWMSEQTPRGLSSLRTSIVTGPDGKIPPMNAEGRKRNQERTAARQRVGIYDSAQTRGLSERCIYWAHEGPPLLPTGYNNNLQIVQSPGEFVIIPEMMPVARIAPLGGRPHPGAAIRNIRGDSRGWWDGDTMVVETTNFTDRTAFRGASEFMKVTERLTLVDANTILYQFTIDDPHTWDRPWSGEYPMHRTNFPMYEYACHEGNYGMANILRAQRKIEAEQRDQLPTR